MTTTEGGLVPDQRGLDVALRRLVELSPQLLVAGALTAAGYLADLPIY